AFAFDVGSPSFEANDVLLLELQLGGVFDGHNALYVGNVAGKHVEQSGLTGAGAAGDEQIQSSLDHDGKQFQHGFGESVILHHVARGDGIASEATDGEESAVEGGG